MAYPHRNSRHVATLAPFQYPIRRLIVRSREVSKPRDLYSELSDRSEIWQSHRHQRCRGACQSSKRCVNLNCQPRGSETSRSLTIRRLNIKMSPYQYRKSHCGNKTILRPSYLHSGISYTDTMTSLYWIRTLILTWSDCGKRHWYTSHENAYT